MSVRLQCDRCGRVDDVMTPVLGYDLCEGCEDCFRVWVKGTRPKRHSKLKGRRRTPVGESAGIAKRLIERDGYVTDVSYGEVAGLSLRDAYYRLQYLQRSGVLERDRMADGEVRFFLPQEMCRAAE